MGNQSVIKLIIDGDITGLNTALEKSSKSIDSWSEKHTGGIMSFSKSAATAALHIAAIAAPAIAAGTAIGAMVRHTANVGEEFLKTSEMIGISVERLSGLSYAAQLSDTDIETLTGGIGSLSKKMHGANEEGDDMTLVFKALGVNTRNTNGELRDTYDVLLEVSDRFSNMEEGAGKTALAMKVFGNGGKELIPLLNKGAAGITEMYNEADRLGVIFSTDAAIAADQFNDNLTRLETRVEGLAKKIAGPLIDSLNILFDRFTDRGAAAARIDEINETVLQLQKNLKFGQEHPVLDLFLGIGGEREKDIARIEKLIDEQDALLEKYFSSSDKSVNPKTPPPQLEDTSRLKKAEDAQKKIQDMIDKQTLSQRELIQKEADEYLKLGVKKDLVNQWVHLEEKKLTQKAREDAIEQMLAHEEQMKQVVTEKQKIRELEQQYEIAKANELHQIKMDLYSAERDYRIQSYEESWQAMFDIANQIGGDAGQGVGQMMAGMKGMSDIYAGEDSYTAKLDQLQEFLRMKQGLLMDGAISELQMQQYYDQISLQMEWATQQQKLSMNVFAMQQIQGALIAFGANDAKRHKEMFFLSRAIGVGMIWVQTQIAAMSAAAAVAGIPIVGPALASAAFAKMQALGYLSMAAAGAAAIGQYASSSGGGGGASSGGGYSYTNPSAPSWEKTEQKASEPQVVQHITKYYINGELVDLDQLARKMVIPNQKAIEDVMGA